MKRLIFLSIIIILLIAIIQVGDYYFHNDTEDSIILKGSEAWQFGEQGIFDSNIHGNYYSFNTVENIEIDFDYIKPEEIYVPAGESIKLCITVHTPCTFKMEGYNIVKKLEPDTNYELEFKSIIPGRFKYTCYQPCNNIDQFGTIIVRD